MENLWRLSPLPGGRLLLLPRAERPGAYVHRLLKGGLKRDAQLGFEQARKLKDQIQEFDVLHAACGRNEDPFDFAARVGSTGTLFAVPQSLRATR